MTDDYAKFLTHQARMVEAAELWAEVRRKVLPAFKLSWCLSTNAIDELVRIAEEYHQLKKKEDK